MNNTTLSKDECLLISDACDALIGIFKLAKVNDWKINEAEKLKTKISALAKTIN